MSHTTFPITPVPAARAGPPPRAASEHICWCLISFSCFANILIYYTFFFPYFIVGRLYREQMLIFNRGNVLH